MKEQCPDIRRLSSFHDGEMAGSEVLEIETHVRDCHRCKGRLEQFRTISCALRGLAERECDASLSTLVVFEDLPARSLRPHSGRSGLRLLPMAFAASLTLSLGVVLGQELTEPEPTEQEIGDFYMQSLAVIPLMPGCPVTDDCSARGES